MKYELFDAYSESADITFILEHCENELGEPISVEVVGFYFGTPTENSTKTYKGSTKATFQPIEHEMDYTEFTAEESAIIKKWLNAAGADAWWISDNHGDRRYLVDFREFGETDTFSSSTELLETARYCLEVWENEEA